MMLFGPKPAVVLQAYSVMPYVKAGAADKEAKRINRFVYALKDGGHLVSAGKKEPAADAFAQAVVEAVAPWFAGAVLLALPGSGVSPAKRAGEKTVVFAHALATRFGNCAVSEDLVRAVAVAKSHRVPPNERPTVATHQASMRLSSAPAKAVPIVLVDDVLTRGATAVAAVQVLRAAGHTGAIRLVCGAHTRFPDEEAETDVEWRIEWMAGAAYPEKSRVKSHAPEDAP